MNSAPLNGSDQLMRGFDHELRRNGFAGNHCQIVLELGGKLPIEALKDRLSALQNEFPVINARLRKYWRPRWKISPRSRAKVALRTHRENPGLSQKLFNEPLRINRGELMRFDLIDRGDQHTLIFTWTHLLMDAVSAENFLSAVSDEKMVLPKSNLQPAGAPAKWPERLDLMKKSVAQLDKFCEQQPRALKQRIADAERGLDYHVLKFSVEETSKIRANASRLCGILGDAQYHAAVVAVELHRLHQKLGCATKSYILPMPVGLRPKGRIDPLFSNQVDMLMLQFLPGDVDSIEKAVVTLKAQATQAVRENSISYGRKLSEIFSFLPLPIYMTVLKHGLKGEICSVFFGDTGSVNPRLESFLGVPVTDFTHLAAVTPSPGLGVIYYYFRNALHVTIVHATTTLTNGETDDFSQNLHARLLNP